VTITIAMESRNLKDLMAVVTAGKVMTF